MGKTLVIYRIKPVEMGETDRVIEAIKGTKSGKFQDAKKDPVGFGVELVKAGFSVPEKDDDAVDALTKELNEMPEIEEAEIVEMTLI
ncbi:MAG: hypothetical protein ABH854_04745 [Candidatus Diapherotrites archaeon]|nr:hypothetical protein [Candidatus Micrarchaeota archaeon]MBU1939375.1 hypothetical protein [Candidatus Micrarchaeota archaeon]